MENQNENNQQKDTDNLQKGEQIKYEKDQPEVTGDPAEHNDPQNNDPEEHQHGREPRKSDNSGSLPDEAKDEQVDTDENDNATLHS